MPNKNIQRSPRSLRTQSKILSIQYIKFSLSTNTAFSVKKAYVSTKTPWRDGNRKNYKRNVALWVRGSVWRLQVAARTRWTISVPGLPVHPWSVSLELRGCSACHLRGQQAWGCTGGGARRPGRLESVRSVCSDQAALTGSVLGCCVGLSQELGIRASCLNLTVWVLAAVT